MLTLSFSLSLFLFLSLFISLSLILYLFLLLTLFLFSLSLSLSLSLSRMFPASMVETKKQAYYEWTDRNHLQQKYLLLWLSSSQGAISDAGN